jgi:Asp-tRNA(Asn)/Glu-tRNA(Gln) amidotransferase A subunit family amidase
MGQKKKWYSYFVVTDDPSPDGSGAAIEAATPIRASDLAPEEPLSEPPTATSSTVDLATVYESAKIELPAHGYSVLKVAEMLASDHLQSLPAEVKRKSILVALEAAGVRVEEIVEDAVRRDRALDTYERVLQGHVDQLAGKATADNQAILDEMARHTAELRARIDENNRQVTEAQAELVAWRTRKHLEETRIAEAVGHFVTENPVTVSARTSQGQGDANVR